MNISFDRFIIEFDKGLRTLLAKPANARANPAEDILEADLSDTQKKQVVALMRVNHTGEVCAQALYSGQAISSKNIDTTKALNAASLEEIDHLAWCESRITELNGRTSLLNPLFYASSFTIGAIAGAVGDKWNLGFLAETEKQVSVHLEEHLQALPEADLKTRAILEQMQTDENHHAEMAREHGAADLPDVVQKFMLATSKIMKVASYRI